MKTKEDPVADDQTRPDAEARSEPAKPEQPEQPEQQAQPSQAGEVPEQGPRRSPGRKPLFGT